MKKRAFSLVLVVLTWLGVAVVGSAPAAHSLTTLSTPSSTVCTTAGSCVTASTSRLPTNTFTVKVTCKATETVYAGVRGYFPDGNFSTAPAKTYNCTPGASFTATRSYLGHQFVGFRAALGPVAVAARLGNYVGTPVGPGHELIDHPLGFHWE